MLYVLYIYNSCKNILLLCLELSSGGSEWGFTGFIGCSWVLSCFTQPWVGRYLRTRKKVSLWGWGNTQAGMWCLHSRVPNAPGGNWLTSLWCLALKWEPPVSVLCMIRTAFLAQNILYKLGRRGHPYRLDLETKMKVCVSGRSSLRWRGKLAKA